MYTCTPPVVLEIFTAMFGTLLIIFDCRAFVFGASMTQSHTNRKPCLRLETRVDGRALSPARSRVRLVTMTRKDEQPEANLLGNNNISDVFESSLFDCCATKDRCKWLM